MAPNRFKLRTLEESRPNIAHEPKSHFMPGTRGADPETTSAHDPFHFMFLTTACFFSQNSVYLVNGFTIEGLFHQGDEGLAGKFAWTYVGGPPRFLTRRCDDRFGPYSGITIDGE